MKSLNHIKTLGMFGLMLAGCNGHPVAPLDESLVVARRQTFRLADRPAVDFLFVIDSSRSMQEEQASLARNMADFADFFVGEGAFDFRIAVTTPDLTVPKPGAFAQQAALDPPPYLGPSAIDLAPCRALEAAGALGPILDPDAIEAACAEAGPDCRHAEMAQRFSCLAVRGADGDGFEKGLEAMRQALSCAGPNRELFGECCTAGRYDPACQPTVEPAFLRPQAKLVVVIVSDEDDCSDQPGTPISRMNLHDCAWRREQLVPVADYVQFLRSLKADPQQQVVVATVVGHDILTEEGVPPTYANLAAAAGCDPDAPDRDPSLTLAQCCPDGICPGGARIVCEATNARAGTRYLALAAAFGAQGLGCPAGGENTEACLSVCADDFAGPVQQILEAARLQRFCLDQRPDCPLDGPCPHLRVSLETPEDHRALAPEEQTLDLLAEDCGSGAALSLAVPPPPGARLIVEYRVEMP